MPEDFDPDAVPCPLCGQDCEHIGALGSGVWFCEGCEAPWTASELAEPRDQEPRDD